MGNINIMKIKRRVPLILLLAVFIIIAAAFWYINDYYHSTVSIADYKDNSSDVLISEIEQGIYLDGPGDNTAMIFYPGAKVEYTAYLPVFYKLSEQGIDCFLLKMPCNLAIFGQNKADDIIKEYNGSYNKWYISGHSLGGAMAASYASKHLEELSGLVLLAGYPAKSLNDNVKAVDFSVLSLYGSEDGVLNLEKLKEGREYMPKAYTEICIEGGNHAGFGNYGEQDGDNAAKISHEEQQAQTVKAIIDMLAE